MWILENWKRDFRVVSMYALSPKPGSFEQSLMQQNPWHFESMRHKWGYLKSFKVKSNFGNLTERQKLSKIVYLPFLTAILNRSTLKPAVLKIIIVTKGRQLRRQKSIFRTAGSRAVQEKRYVDNFRQSLLFC